MGQIIAIVSLPSWQWTIDIVQAFQMAAAAVPTRQNFIASLAAVPEDRPADPRDPQSDLDPGGPVFMGQLNSDATAYIAGIDRALRSINAFYGRHRLDPAVNEHGEIVISD